MKKIFYVFLLFIMCIGIANAEKCAPNPNNIGIISLRNGGYSEIGKYSGGYYYDYTLLKAGLIEKHLANYNKYMFVIKMESI